MVDSGLSIAQQLRLKAFGQRKSGRCQSAMAEFGRIDVTSRSPRWITSLAHPRKYDMTVSKLKKLLLLDFTKSEVARGLKYPLQGKKQGEIGLLSDICRQFGFSAVKVVISMLRVCPGVRSVNILDFQKYTKCSFSLEPVN